MICGDYPLPFPYRSSSNLTAFFSGLGLDYEHDGSARNAWAKSVMKELNSMSPEDGPLPSHELVAVIEELVDPTYFSATEDPSSKLSLVLATERLNTILRQYELIVAVDKEAGRPRLQTFHGESISTANRGQETTRVITFAPSVFHVPDGKVQQDLASVMMPFSAEFRLVYEAIKSTCVKNGLRCMRADDIWANSTIIQDVFDLLFMSFVVIVDFTSKNPNVLYETGIAHALGKHVVPISQTLDDVPFDLQSHRVLKYLPNREGLDKLQADLSKRLDVLVRGHSWQEL